MKRRNADEEWEEDIRVLL